MLRPSCLATSAILAALVLPASADPIVDFSDLSTLDKVTSLGPSTTYGGITASAFYFDSVSSTWTASTLIARDETNDSGLGVCSEPSGCNIGSTGGGDFNELSQLSNYEAILLQRPAGYSWTGLYLSSLDNNGGSTSLGVENGTLYWGNTSNIATLVGGTGFSFSWPSFGSAVEGQLTLPGTFDSNALYVLFVPGSGVGDTGDNNDYLVWGADIEPVQEVLVPEPGILALMASGIATIVSRRRRSRVA